MNEFKKIKNIHYKTMRNDEFKGIHSAGVQFAKELTAQQMLPLVRDYESAYNEFSRYMDKNADESVGHVASLLHEERRNLFSKCRKAASVASDYPNEGAAEAGAKVWKIFEHLNMSRLNQVQMTGYVDDVVNGLRGLGEDVLNACGFKTWVDRLDEANKNFERAAMDRNAENGQREHECGLKLRRKCSLAFELVAFQAVVLAAQGDASCDKFIYSVNDAVKTKLAQVDSRRTRGKTAKLADDSVTENPATEEIKEHAA